VCKLLSANLEEKSVLGTFSMKHLKICPLTVVGNKSIGRGFQGVP